MDKERMEKFSQRERDERREAYLRCILWNKGKVQKVVQRYNNGEKKGPYYKKRKANKQTNLLVTQC
jgi:hypothetical protein